jgi:tripartite-type tricarboxylate transporter receptor subunit TctC
VGLTTLQKSRKIHVIEIIMLMKIIAILFLLLSATTRAQQIDIIVPFPPGGAVDFIARQIAAEISSTTSYTTAVLNRAGADGIIAGREFLDPKGNPNKLYLASGGATLFTKLTRKANEWFDPIDDFELMGPVAIAPTTLIVTPNGRFKNWNEFVTVARQETVLCGTSNSTATFFLRLLSSRERLKIETVSYKGTADLTMNLLGNHIECGVDAVPAHLELFKTQKLIPLALSARDHNNVITAPIVNVSSFRFENFFAVAMSRNMDSNVRQTLTKLVSELRNNVEFKQKMNERGFSMPTFNANYTSIVQQDYLVLEKIRLQLGIQKN